MPHTDFEIVSPAARFDRFPMEIRQRTSSFSALMLLALLVPAVAAMAMPFGLVAAHAVAQPDPMALILDKPLASLQVLIAAAMYLLVFVPPIRRLLAHIGRDRIIRFADAKVLVTDRHLLRKTTWALPVSAFRGIAHNVRTTISATRQELILVHADKRYSLLLYSGDVIAADIIQDACRLMALPQLPSRDLYFKLDRIWRLRLAAIAPGRNLFDQATS